MIFRNLAFFALVVTLTTLNYASAERAKLRGRWQVGDAKQDASVEDSAAGAAGTIDVLRRRRGLKKDDKKGGKDDKKGTGSKDIGDRNDAKKKFDAKDETAVISNYAGFGNTSNAAPAKDKKDDKKSGGGGGGGDKKKKVEEVGQYAGKFNYAAVRPQAWNPSAVTLGPAQPSNTNYASPGAATGNLVSSTPVGVYNVNKVRRILECINKCHACRNIEYTIARCVLTLLYFRPSVFSTLISTVRAATANARHLQ